MDIGSPTHCLRTNVELEVGFVGGSGQDPFEDLKGIMWFVFPVVTDTWSYTLKKSLLSIRG